SHYASHYLGASFARQGLPDVLVALDVAEDDAEGLEELAGWSCCLLGCLPLGGQCRADVLEPGREQIVLVAVVRIKGRPSDVGPVEFVWGGGAFTPPLWEGGERRALRQPARSPSPPVDLGCAHGCLPFSDSWRGRVRL